MTATDAGGRADTGRQVGSAASALATRVAAAGGFAVSSAVLTRRLDPAAFGTVNVMLSVATATSFVVAAGLNRVLLRDVAGALATGLPGRVHADVGVARRVLLISTPIGMVLTVVLGALVSSGQSWAALAIAAVVTAALGVLLITSDLLRGLGEVAVANLTAGRSGGALTLCTFSALLLVWSATGTVVGALVAYLAALTVASGAGLWRARTVLARVPRTPEPAPQASAGVATMARIAWPFAATQLALFLTSQVDLWVASASLGDSDAGYYSAALRFMTLVALPLQAVQLTMIARIARLHATDRTDLMQRQVQRAALAAAVPALAVLVPCLLAPATLLEIAFGPGYEVATLPLQVLALSQIVNVLSGLCGAVLAMSGNERGLLVVTAAGALTTLVASWVGATASGLDGLAIGSAVSTAAMYTALWLLARVKVGIWTHPWPHRRA